MFNPKTNKIEVLSTRYDRAIKELEQIFDKPTNIYIDFANVLGWQDKLGWRIDPKRLKQFLDSFDTIGTVKFYYGTLAEDEESERLIKWVGKLGYDVNTKPVKIIRLSIDVSSIPLNSPILLENFIRKPLLSKFDLETIEYLNKKLRELNEKKILYIKDKKCNFDVEIGRDMLLDYEKNRVENFILWSGDSDFADPVSQLLQDSKKVVIFATSRRVAVELSETKARIFDIKKIKEFICWKKYLSDEIKLFIKSQKDSRKSP